MSRPSIDFRVLVKPLRERFYIFQFSRILTLSNAVHICSEMLSQGTGRALDGSGVARTRTCNALRKIYRSSEGKRILQLWYLMPLPEISHKIFKEQELSSSVRWREFPLRLRRRRPAVLNWRAWEASWSSSDLHSSNSGLRSVFLPSLSRSVFIYLIPLCTESMSSQDQYALTISLIELFFWDLVF